MRVASLEPPHVYNKKLVITNGFSYSSSSKRKKRKKREKGWKEISINFPRESKLAAVFFEYKRRGGIIVIGRVCPVCYRRGPKRSTSKTKKKKNLLCFVTENPARLVFF
jgi:hypothetical protein